jgi:iron complex outermembrane receptor protein
MQAALKLSIGLLIASSVCVQSPAAAQAGAGNSSGQSADHSAQLEEVVVTAQRREQDSQKVPISISAFSEKDAEKLGIRSTDELAAVVPGLSYFQLFNGAAFFIRGIGKSDTNTGQELPVAVYIDGAYLATPTGGLFSLNNIDHVEVLKGPQGTLFGRNATGGVVQVVTKQPQQDPSLDVSVGYGNYGKQQESLYGTMGLTPTLAADIAAYYTSQSEGWGHNLNLNTPVYMPREFDLRSKWLWTPNDDTSITLAADFANVYSDVGTALAIWPGATGFLGYKNVGWYNIDSDISPFSAYQQFGVTLTAKENLSWALFNSISSYHDLKERVNYDGDGTPIFGEVAGRKYPADTLTQELQLLSPKSSTIQWIGGFYFLNQTTATNPLTISGLALGAGPTFVLNQDASQHTDSYAAYGEATFPIAGDDTHLTTGARYTLDKRELWSKSNDNFNDVYPTINQEAQWSSPTWRVVLDHQFTPDVYSYLQYTRGFKSGQFNVIAPSNPPVKPEKIDAYEMGTKTTLFDRRLRLNGAVYYYDYSDIQLTRVILAGNELYNAAKAKIKGADADFDFAATRNLELRGGVSYFDGIYSSFPNAPAFYPAFGGGNTSATIDATGKFMIDSPKWEGNVAAVYTIPSSIGSFSVTGLYSINSGYFFEPDNRVRQPEFHIVNATLEWKSLSETFGIRLWGKNLTNAEYVSFNTENAFGDQYSVSPPRTYGIDLLYHFGK